MVVARLRASGNCAFVAANIDDDLATTGARQRRDIQAPTTNRQLHPCRHLQKPQLTRTVAISTPPSSVERLLIVTSLLCQRLREGHKFSGDGQHNMEHPVAGKQPSSIHIQPPSNAASKQSGYTNNVPPRGPQRQAKSARQQRGSGEQ
jgi:hypothetical protein